MDRDDSLKEFCDKLKEVMERMQIKTNNKVTILKSNLVANDDWSINQVGGE